MWSFNPVTAASVGPQLPALGNRNVFALSINPPLGFSSGTMVKNLPANTGDTRDTGSIPGLGRLPGEENGNPLQYFCLENPMVREAWWAIVYRVAKSWTLLK